MFLFCGWVVSLFDVLLLALRGPSPHRDFPVPGKSQPLSSTWRLRSDCEPDEQMFSFTVHDLRNLMGTSSGLTPPRWTRPVPLATWVSQIRKPCPNVCNFKKLRVTQNSQKANDLSFQRKTCTGPQNSHLNADFKGTIGRRSKLENLTPTLTTATALRRTNQWNQADTHCEGSSARPMTKPEWAWRWFYEIDGGLERAPKPDDH